MLFLGYLNEIKSYVNFFRFDVCLWDYFRLLWYFLLDVCYKWNLYGFKKLIFVYLMCVVFMFIRNV